MPGSSVTVRRRLKDGSVKVYTYERRAKNAPPGPESMAWLVREYLKSPDYTGLRLSSQKTYRAALRYVDPIRTKHLSEVQRKHIIKIRDHLADRPSLANMFVSVMGAVFRFALERGHREDFNPADSIRPLEEGEGQPWPDDALQAARAGLTGPLRTAFLLALNTGQRRGDILAMKWSQYRDGWITLTQQKTGKPLQIPVSPELAAELDSLERKSVQIVGLTIRQFSEHWPRAMRGLGLHGLKFHGLRHTALTILAEMGATEHELQAIGGHASIASLQRYTKAARQKELAARGMAKVFDFAPGAKGQKKDASN